MNYAVRAIGQPVTEYDAKAIQSLWVAGKRDQATARVPDDMVLKFGLIGTPAMIKERVALYEAAGVSTLNLRFPAKDNNERIENLARLIEVIRN